MSQSKGIASNLKAEKQKFFKSFLKISKGFKELERK